VRARRRPACHSRTHDHGRQARRSPVGLGAMVGVDLLDVIGLLPQVQDLAAVVEVAGMVPIVVHRRVHQPDQPTMAAGIAEQV
jgi:hypothetical protein